MEENKEINDFLQENTCFYLRKQTEEMISNVKTILPKNIDNYNHICNKIVAYCICEQINILGTIEEDYIEDYIKDLNTCLMILIDKDEKEKDI